MICQTFSQNPRRWGKKPPAPPRLTACLPWLFEPRKYDNNWPSTSYWLKQLKEMLEKAGKKHVLARTKYSSAKELNLTDTLSMGRSTVGESIGLACCWCRFDSTVQQGIFLSVARDFSLRVYFQCRLSYIVSVQPLVQSHALTSVRMLKDPIVHVRVLRILETLKHPACTLGWVAHLCCSWLSQRNATRISHWRNPIGTIEL